MKKLIIFFSLFIILLYGEDKIIAIVGNKPIFEIEIIRKSKVDNIPPSIAFNQLIEEKLLLYQAEKKGVEVKEEEIKSEIERIKKSFPSLKEFYSYIKSLEMNMAQIENEIANNLKIRKLIKSEIIDKIEITPVEIANEFKKIEDESNEYEFYFKWFNTKEEGENFIKNFSQESLKDMEYTKLKSSEIIDEILNQISKMEKEKISELIQVKTKWIVIYLKDKAQRDIDKYEKYKEVKDRIFKTKYSSLYRNYIEELKKSVPIEIF